MQMNWSEKPDHVVDESEAVFIDEWCCSRIAQILFDNVSDTDGIPRPYSITQTEVTEFVHDDNGMLIRIMNHDDPKRGVWNKSASGTEFTGSPMMDFGTVFRG